MRTGTPEAPVLRRTRWRLIAWSGGTTLVVLLVLGIAIYVAAASSLAAAGTAQLQARIDELSGAAFGRTFTAPAPMVGVTYDPSQPGLVIGGDASGTIGFVMMPGPGPGDTGPVGPASSATRSSRAGPRWSR